MMDIFDRIVLPVLYGFADKSIAERFIPQTAPDYSRPPNAAILEAFCRTIMSVAPYCENETYRDVIFSAWKSVIDDKYIDWSIGDQLLVESANLVYAFLLYPKSWSLLPTSTQIGIMNILIRASNIKPYKNNWYLFKCIVDIFLFKHGKLRSLHHIFTLLDEFESWYVGDGWYKDGPTFHMDYYNSFVIYPFLYIIYNELRRKYSIYQLRFDTLVERMKLYCVWLERQIAPDGSFPLIGRSIVYRSAVFHTLAFCAVHVGLPSSLSIGQVFRGLRLVHTRLWHGDSQFDSAGFLNLGFIGNQPSVANKYSNNGSCYFTGLSFSIYTLPNVDESPITQEKMWMT